MTGSHELVAGGTSFGLRALRGQQVTETGRAADQLTRSGYLEALGNGLFGLLHEESGGKQRTPGRLASVLSDKVATPTAKPLTRPVAVSCKLTVWHSILPLPGSCRASRPSTTGGADWITGASGV